MSRLMRTLRWTVPVALVAALAAHPGLAGADGKDPVARGKELFSDTRTDLYPSCAHCHSLLPPDEEQKRAEHLGPGASLWGSAQREGWRNMNTSAGVGDALQPCAKWWQERKGGFPDADRDALAAYLETIGPEDGAKLPKREVEKKPKMIEDFDGGDAARGEKLTERYCGGCHNDADEALSARLKPGKKRKASIVRQVRGYDANGKFKPIETTMSYFTTDRLPDEDLRHILAYLGK
jgi:mono/diheme cytochrome c family protein